MKSLPATVGLVFLWSASAAFAQQCSFSAPKVFPIIRIGADRSELESGVATSIDARGFFLTAKHVAQQKDSADQKLFIRTDRGNFEIETVFQSTPDATGNQTSLADWAIVRAKGLRGQQFFDLTKLDFEIPTDFSYAARDASVFTARSGTGLTVVETKITPAKLERDASPADYRFCPPGHSVLIQTQAAYDFGDSGSPVVDGCGNLLGITSAFHGAPHIEANNTVEVYNELVAAVTKADEINAFDQPKKQNQSTSIENTDPEEEKKKKAREESLKVVDEAWIKLAKTMSDAHFVVMTPVSCIAGELLALSDKERNAVPVKQEMAIAVDELKRGRKFEVATAKKLNPNIISMIDWGHIVSATKLLRPFKRVEFAAYFDREIIAPFGAAQLYADFRDASGSPAFSSFREYLMTVRELTWRNYELNRRIEQFLRINEKSPSLATAPLFDPAEFDSGTDQLIDSGRRYLTSVPRPGLETEPYRISFEQSADLNNAIQSLATGADRISQQPISEMSTTMRRYVANVYADLALALQFKRRLLTQGDVADSGRVAPELKAARIALFYNPGSVVAWDVASRGFRALGSTKEAWILAGLALQARCGKSCSDEFLKQSDGYAQNLLSNIKAFSKELIDTEPEISEIIEEIVSGDMSKSEGLKAKGDWFNEILYEYSFTAFTTECSECPAIPVVKSLPENAYEVPSAVSYLSASDWIETWSGVH